MRSETTNKRKMKQKIPNLDIIEKLRTTSNYNKGADTHRLILSVSKAQPTTGPTTRRSILSRRQLVNRPRILGQVDQIDFVRLDNDECKVLLAFLQLPFLLLILLFARLRQLEGPRGRSIVFGLCVAKLGSVRVRSPGVGRQKEASKPALSLLKIRVRSPSQSNFSSFEPGARGGEKSFEREQAPQRMPRGRENMNSTANTELKLSRLDPPSNLTLPSSTAIRPMGTQTALRK